MNQSTLLTSSRDLYQKLLQDYADFNNDPLSAYKALDCAAVAWHLTDWVFHEYEKLAFPNVGSMREEFYKSCDDLKTMHDLATGLKHFTISNPKSNMSGSHLHQGGFSRAFSFGFNVSRLEIQYSDKASEPIDLLLERVVNFWSDYFSDKN
ncbi:hypothetical protein Q0590_14180 [Rhodocytophaga aerolata]|uniref:Uncharacterized protein n=1 Tax=Rhodocytophaga aerolata TaxID=455078 RepID=A0ABT8R5Q5_9BACT|nr:hypothetical protein [Rhodocytophaga aerolata]MDO1447412.1 hypothetical protein [Rhodocytophaga aerolata]